MAGATIITGVSSGIGLETAIYLAQRGFRVVGTMRDPGKSAALDAAAQQAGVAIDVFPLDLHDSASIEKTIGDIASKYGSIDALVNNAGLQLRGYFEDLTEQEIRGVFETNLFGTMAVTRSVLPRMRAARRGRMVFISSVGGLVGSPGLSAYCASKFALEGFADSLSFEMALFGVHVSIVEPGLIPTPMWKTNLRIAERGNDPSSPNHRYFTESERIAARALETSGILTVHVARAIHRALSSPKPRLRYLIGSRAAAFLLMRRLLPTPLFDRAYYRTVVGKLKRAAEV